MQKDSVLEMRGISKSFYSVKALQNVDFTLREGEIHALMGENGAGKSTLIKVLTGVYEKDEGEVYLKGVEGAVHIKSPEDAQNLGISTVYQEITLCPNLTVAENMYIGRGKAKITRWRKMNSDATRILESLQIPAKADQQLGTCSIAVQQMVAIARAVDMDCKVLILDEPTAGQDYKHYTDIMEFLRSLNKLGITIIMITHDMHLMLEYTTHAVVIAGGRKIGDSTAVDILTNEEIAKAANLKLTSLYELAKKCGLSDPQSFVSHFIDHERREERHEG